MIGGVTRHMLPHLSGVPYLQMNRPLDGSLVRDPKVPFLGPFSRRGGAPQVGEANSKIYKISESSQ